MQTNRQLISALIGGITLFTMCLLVYATILPVLASILYGYPHGDSSFINQSSLSSITIASMAGGVIGWVIETKNLEQK